MEARGTTTAVSGTALRLFAVCLKAEELRTTLVESMLKLFRQCYAGVDEQRFRRDLAEKSHVIVVFDEFLRLRGFSTLVVWRHAFQDRPINLLFSGDTVIEPSAWGLPALPVAFLSAAGAVHAADPGVPFYWLLTTKGHRTFQFMPLFFYQFYPGPGLLGESDAALARSIGATFFSERYDPERGVLVGKPFSGSLTPALAMVPEKDRGRTDVRYFLERNPEYTRGDELLCIARMTPSNLRPFARRPFQRGIECGLLDEHHGKARDAWQGCDGAGMPQY